jgi:hypothetical protein
VEVQDCPQQHVRSATCLQVPEATEHVGISSGALLVISVDRLVQLLIIFVLLLQKTQAADVVASEVQLHQMWQGALQEPDLLLTVGTAHHSDHYPHLTLPN